MRTWMACSFAVFATSPALGQNWPNLSSAYQQAQSYVRSYHPEHSSNWSERPNSRTESAASIRHREAIQHYNSGNHLFREGKYKEALEEYRASLKIESDPDTYHNFAHCCINLDSFDSAIQALQYALRLDSGFAKAHHALGWIYFKQKRYKEAIEAYTQTTRLDSDYFDGYCGMADSYYELATSKDEGLDLADKWAYLTWALDAYNRARRLRPGDEDVYRAVYWCHLEIGRAQARRKKTDEAIEAYRDAIRNSPNQLKGWAHIELGDIYFEQKDFEKAARIYAQAARVAPQNEFAHYNLGRTQYTLDRYEDALRAFTSARDLKPERSVWWNNVGIAHLRLGHIEDAIQNLERAHLIDPNERAARANLHEAYEAQLTRLETHKRGNRKELERIRDGLSSYSNGLEEWSTLTERSQKAVARDARNMVLHLGIKKWADQIEANEEILKDEQKTLVKILGNIHNKVRNEEMRKEIADITAKILQLRGRKEALEGVGSLWELVSAQVENEDDREKIADSVIASVALVSRDPRVRLFEFGYNAAKLNVTVGYAYFAGKVSEERVRQLLDLTDSELNTMQNSGKRYLDLVNQVKGVKERMRQLE